MVVLVVLVVQQVLIMEPLGVWVPQLVHVHGVLVCLISAFSWKRSAKKNPL
jgi:hypothetical protein